MDQIANSPGLSASRVSMANLWAMQLEKVVVNSVINPLTAIMRCRNSELLIAKGDGLVDTIDSLIREASEILTSLSKLPSTAQILKNTDDDTKREAVCERFSYDKLRATTLSVIRGVRESKSSMLQDVEHDKKTEIAFFNGWIIDAAESMGRREDVPTHRKLIPLVENGTRLSRTELLDYIRKA